MARIFYRIQRQIRGVFYKVARKLNQNAVLPELEKEITTMQMIIDLVSEITTMVPESVPEMVPADTRDKMPRLDDEGKINFQNFQNLVMLVFSYYKYVPRQDKNLSPYLCLSSSHY